MEDIIAELEAKEITKKAACEALGFLTPAGNPQYKKLETAIEEFKVRKAADKRIRAKKRTEAFTDREISDMISMYLAGQSLASLSEHFYRSIAVIKYRLELAGALLRRTSSPDTTEMDSRTKPEHCEYENPILLPEKCVVESHNIGDMVWSTRYAQLAKVVKEVQPGVYRIFMSSEGQRKYAYQPTEELGSLKHLQDLGVQFKLVSNEY